MSDNPFAVDNPIYEPDWEKGSQEAVKRLQNQPSAKEKFAPLPRDYEEVLQIVDNRVESYIAERQIPDYLVDKDIRDLALDTMSKDEVGQLREAARKLSGSTDLGHMLTQAQESQNLSDISKEKISTVVLVRNFLAYEDVVDFATRVNNLALAKHLTTEQALNKVLEGSKLDRKQVAKKFIYAVNSGSYKRLKGGEVPEERRDREDRDTYPTVRFIGSILRPQIEEVKKEVEEIRTERKARLSTQTVEVKIPFREDYDHITNLIDYMSENRRYNLWTDENISSAEILELSAQYTGAVQSGDYSEKLATAGAKVKTSEAVSYGRASEIQAGFDLVNKFLSEKFSVLENSSSEDLALLKDAYSKAMASGFYDKLKKESEDELSPSRQSKYKVLAWFEKLQVLFEPPKKPTPPFRISLR